MNGLLHCKAGVYARDIFEKTVLHIAGEYDHLDAVKTCLKFSADVNIVDNFNKTALHLAFSRGHSELMKELLDCKPSVNTITYCSRIRSSRCCKNMFEVWCRCV